MQKPNLLKINMFGEFSLTYGENRIDDTSNRSKKIWALLAYLITFRDKEVSQEELIDLLWSNNERDNPANNLKTLLHRVRSMIDVLGIGDSRHIVRYRRGSYSWYCPVPMVLDTQIFEELCSKGSDITRPISQRIEYYLQALDLYQGDFLTKHTGESWVIPLSVYYKTMYIKAVETSTSLLAEEIRWDDIIRICQHAVSLDPYEESIHYKLIQAFLGAGNQHAALKHYNYAIDLFYNKLGVNLSKKFTALYKKAMKSTQNQELDLNIIKNDLNEQNPLRGAFFCQYEFFKDIYQLEARSTSRTGQVVYIALLTIMDKEDETPPQKLLAHAMEHLQNTIYHSLRRGDVFTRYSVSQYLIMLPANFENSDMILNRIIKQFHRENSKMAVSLHYKLLPLDPIA